MANIFLREGNIDFARRTYDVGFERTNGENAKLAYDWGKFEEAHGDMEEARRLYKQASTYKSYWHVPLVAWANAEYILGNRTEAQILMSDAASRFDSSIDVLTSWAKMNLAGSNYALARSVLQRALRLDNTKASVWNTRALVEYRARDFQRAKNIIETAFKFVPKHETTSWCILMTTYARILAKLNAYDEAERSLEKAITLNPSNFHSYVIGARNVLVPQKKYEDAIVLLKQALSVSKLKNHEFIRSVLKDTIKQQ